MENKKICFITCVNDEDKYRECLLYISKLKIPEGYEIECAAIRNATSMAGAYNEAMKGSDAKYKVYIHQDVFIVNTNFIFDMLDIFNSDEKIGLIGVIGAIALPADAVWWNASAGCGKAYDNYGKDMSLLCYAGTKKKIQEVQAVDGLIFMTQYDVPHRSDLFDGWDFYDISLCVEFKRRGYKTVVPDQSKPWCVHDCGDERCVENYEHYRQKFIREYSKDLYPLVSILIPTYNRPEYFRLALESAIKQSYINTEIIVGDDSTNDETEVLMRENYLEKYDNIKYYHNSKNLGQFENDIKLMNMANGEYVNFLMDDDLFAEKKIEKMMNFFLQDLDDRISIVTSHRNIIDENGSNAGIFGNTDRVINKTSIFEGLYLGNFMLEHNYNLIGEPTTVLFKKGKLTAPFGTFNGRKYYCNVDQATWLELLSKGRAVFINEALSSYRWHKDQQLKNQKNVLGGAVDYAHQVLSARTYGFLSDASQYGNALSTCRQYVNSVVTGLDEASLSGENKQLFKECKEMEKELSQSAMPV